MTTRRYLWLVLVLVLFIGCSDSGGQGAVTLEPQEASFSFGVVRADQPTIRRLQLSKPIVPEAMVTLVEPQTGPFTPAPGELPATAESGISYAIDVQFAPTGAAPPSSHEGSLHLRFTRVDGGVSIDVIVRLSAQTEVAGVSLETPTANLGTLATGERRRQGIIVRNTSAVTPVEIESAGPLPDGFHFDFDPHFPMLIPAGDDGRLWLVFEPETPGVHDFELDLETPVAPLDVAVRAEAIAGEIVVDLGDVAVDPDTLETSELEVPVSDRAVSLTFQIQAGADEFLFPLSLTGPSGEIFIDASDPLAGPLVWQRNTPSGFLSFDFFPREELNLQVPNSDDPAVQLVPGGGSYRLRLGVATLDPTTVRVQAIIKQRGTSEATEGTLNLNVFLADGITPTASTAPTNGKLQEILSGLDAILAQGGLRIGDVAYYDVADPGLDDIPDEAIFRTLLEQSDFATDTRLNLFLVRAVGGGDIPTGVIGASGAIPGAKRNGTPYAGVMVAFNLFMAEQIAFVAAHEIGHYLGLFHTVEEFGAHDFIADTAECPPNGTNTTCPTQGNGYLMHWLALFVPDPVITEGQRRVMLGHPVVSAGVPPRGATLSQGDLNPTGILAMGPPAVWCAHCGGLE